MATKNNLEKSLQELKNEELKDIIKKTPSVFLRYGNALLFFLMIFTFILCSVIKYPEIVEGDVIISSKDPPQKIYTNVSGRIDSILIKDNDTIKENAIIAVLENTAIFEDVQLLKRLLESVKIDSQILDFQLDDFPVLALGEIDGKFGDFEDSFEHLSMLNELKFHNIKSVSNLYSISEKKNKLSNLILQEKINSQELFIRRKELKRYKALFENDVISKQNLEKKQIELLQAEKSAQNTLVNISELKNEINLSNESLHLNDIDKLRTEKKAHKSLVQDYNSLNISISEWERKYLIKSSRHGKVSFSKYFRENDYVREGELFVSVVPIEGIRPLAKIKTSIKKSGKIEIGQRVNIKLDNYPFLEYGMLVGKVTNISLTPDDNNLYLIDVAIDENLITSYNKKLTFKHEMIGTGSIITEDITLLERLFNRLRELVVRNQ